MACSTKEEKSAASPCTHTQIEAKLPITLTFERDARSEKHPPPPQMQQSLSRASRRALHVSLPACTGAQPVHHRGKPPAPPTLAHTRVFTPAAAVADIQASRTLVFGDAVGNGRRSGRKWLRRPLRGPGIGSYYGVNFRDLLPSLITPEKEDLFRAEQALNRVGKTRITGKQKPFTKPLVDTMLFEEELDEVRLRGRGVFSTCDASAASSLPLLAPPSSPAPPFLPPPPQGDGEY